MAIIEFCHRGDMSSSLLGKFRVGHLITCVGFLGLAVSSIIPVSWQQWAAQIHGTVPDGVWATHDGRALPHNHLLMPGQSYLLRLRGKLRGSGKEVNVKEKLSQLLVSKGVSQDAVEVRVRDILSVIGEDQVLQEYSSFDPWIVLKTLAGQKIRLVTPDELKLRKKHARHASRSSDDGPDPWEFEDPWSQAKRSHDKPAPTNSGSLDIQLVPEHFSKENGDSPDILSTIQRDACGICLLSSDELLMFSAMPAHISPHECAAVVIGDELEHARRFPCSQVTFVAQHATAGKVLLKRSLINFGAQVIVARKAPREFALSTQNLKVITFEVHSGHCPSWQNIKHNPIRHMWRSLSKVQSKVLTTWARRYFNGKKQVAPADATSFHCFARVLAEGMRMILAQSGVEGIFITPKGEQGLADGSYRVVWLAFDALEQGTCSDPDPAQCLGSRQRSRQPWLAC